MHIRPSVENLTERFKTACDLRQPVDRARIATSLETWLDNVSQQKLRVRVVETEDEALKVSKAASAAWAARGAWDARGAWAARDAWSASAARAAGDARAARAAGEAWGAWAARGAWDARGASWEIFWLAPVVIGARQTEDDARFDHWYPLFEAAEAGAFCFWVTDKELAFAEIPKVVAIDGQRLLHCTTGPAFDFLSRQDYYLKGVHVPELVVMRPHEISVGLINNERNTEVRRIMIERYGTARYLQDSGAKKLGQDAFGILWRRDVPEDEPIVMVEVLNPTPEPDGTLHKAEALARFFPGGITPHRSMAYIAGHGNAARYKTYFLRVHPECRPLIADPQAERGFRLGPAQPLTPHAAVASTYGKTADEYDPVMRT